MGAEIEIKQRSVQPKETESLRPADDVLGAYFEEISQYPLLGPAEEVALAKRIERGRQDVTFAADGKEAATEFANSNLRLVIKFVKPLFATGVPQLDLIQEGNTGLMDAINRFDYKRGHRFSTFARARILQKVFSYLRHQGWDFKAPQALTDKYSRFHRTEHALMQRLGRKPTEEELAEALGWEQKMVAKMRIFLLKPVSFDVEPEDREDGYNLLSRVATGHFDELDNLQNQEVAKVIREVLEALPERHQQVFHLHYGEGLDWAQIARRINNATTGDKGVTRERARQIDFKIRCRLKFELEKRGINRETYEDLL